MRKILSLLLILALFLPCALAETPQGIDLALTSTDAAGQQVSLTGSLCTPESPVIPDAIGTIELTQLLDGLF